MRRWRAAAPTEPVRATASKVSSAGNSAASTMKQSLTFPTEPFTGLHGRPEAAYALVARARSSRRRSSHGQDAARQSVGRAHRPDLAVRADPAPDRPAPDPRGDDATGISDAPRLEAQGADARAHVRHARPHHPDNRSDPPL